MLPIYSQLTSTPQYKSLKITNHSSKGNQIPTLVNGFIDSYIELPRVKRPTYAKHKVLLIGDKHAKKCSTLLQNNFGTDYNVSSFVKPGAQMNEIMTAREEVKSLNSDDLVLLWGGVNDISKNNVKEALKSSEV